MLREICRLGGYERKDRHKKDYAAHASKALGQFQVFGSEYDPEDKMHELLKRDDFLTKKLNETPGFTKKLDVHRLTANAFIKSRKLTEIA